MNDYINSYQCNYIFVLEKSKLYAFKYNLDRY